MSFSAHSAFLCDRLLNMFCSAAYKLAPPFGHIKVELCPGLESNSWTKSAKPQCLCGIILFVLLYRNHRCAARSQLLSSIYILQLLSFVAGDGGCACPSSSAVCLFSAMAAKICSRRCWGFLENAGATGSCAGWRDVLYPLKRPGKPAQNPHEVCQRKRIFQHSVLCG